MRKINYTQPTIEVLELDIQNDIMTLSGEVIPPVEEQVPQQLEQTGMEVQVTDYAIFQ